MTGISERVTLYLHIADEGGDSRSMSTEMRRKVDAVRRVRGQTLKKLEDRVEMSAGVHNAIAEDPTNPNLPWLKKEMEERAKELADYKAASALIEPWLQETDEELYDLAANVPPIRHNLCNCHAANRDNVIREEDLAWIKSLSESKSQSTTTTTTKENRKRTRGNEEKKKIKV